VTPTTSAGFDIPQDIDGATLSESQRMAYGTLLEQLVLVAQHPVQVAQVKATRVFRLMYALCDGAWQARESIPLGHHKGAQVRNKFYKRDQFERTLKRTGDRA
jgi:hypothetical protein